MRKAIVTVVVLILLSSLVFFGLPVFAQTYVATQIPGQPLNTIAGEPAYQVMIPEETGSETGLKAFPPKLEVGDAGKDNWLAASHPYKDVPVGTYTYDTEGDTVAVDKYSGKIYIDSLTNSLVISAGALSEKCKYDIEISSYTTYGGETAWNTEKSKYVVNELRARFRDYVYGSGSDLYQLEDTPQNKEIVKREIKAVRVYAIVKGTGTASTKILVNTKKYNGIEIILTSEEQRIGTTYTTNPATGLVWTWQDLDDSQAGITLKNGECSFVYVEVELVVHTQTFYPITPIEVTPGTANAWTDVLGANFGVPAGATGVILHLVNTSSDTNYAIGLRKNTSTDGRTAVLSYDIHCWAGIGVDASRIFEAYVGSITAIDIYLVGYTISGVTFFTNAYDKSLTATLAWTDIACATQAPSAIGLIFETVNTGNDYAGLRKNGSSDNRTTFFLFHNQFGVIIGCDTSQICEGYVGSTDTDFFLVGYITDGCTFNTNATNVSLGTIATWLDLAALPTSSVMGFIEIVSANTKYAFGLRKNGSAEDIYRGSYYHPWAFVECDATRIIEGEIANVGVDFFVVGYATAPTSPIVTVSAATNIGTTTATLPGNVTATGGENPNVTMYWGDNDGGTTPANWDYNSVPTSPTQPQGVAAFYKNATGLAPGTTLYFSAKGTNSGGTGWGTTRTFYTKPSVPTSLVDSARTATSITMNWTAGTGSEKTMLRYRTDTYPTTTSDGTQAYYNTGTSYAVPSLSSGQIYYFSAWAWDTNSGYSSTYVTSTAYTLPGDPPELTATAISEVRIDLTWTKGTAGDKTMVRYRNDIYPTSPTNGTQTYFDTASSYSHTGLTAGTPYYYRAWAYDSDSGYYSSGYSQGTAVTYGPPSVTTVAATYVKTTSAKLNGNIISVNGENADYRGFVWATANYGNPGDITPASSSYSPNYYSYPGSFEAGTFNHTPALTLGTIYYFRAYAHNAYGWKYGDELSFETSSLTLWFQPNAIIIGTTLPDRAGNNDGTFNWGSNPTGVSANMTSFGPVAESKAPAYSAGAGGTLITTTHNVTGQFGSTVATNVTIPGAQVVQDASTASSTPSLLPFTILSAFGLLALWLVMGWVFRRFGTGHGTLFFKILIISAVMGFFVATHVMDFWQLVFWLLMALAIAMASQHQGFSGVTSELNLIGFLAMAFVGMTLVNRVLEGAFITSSDVGIINTLTWTKDQIIFGTFSIPVPNTDFFFVGLPRLVKWDYSFFGGNAGIMQYFLYSFTAVTAFVAFMTVIGLLGQYFLRTR